MTEAENIWRNLHVINYFQIQQANSSVHPRETSSLKVQHSREKKAEGIGFTLGRRNIPDKKNLGILQAPSLLRGWVDSLPGARPPLLQARGHKRLVSSLLSVTRSSLLLPPLLFSFLPRCSSLANPQPQPLPQANQAESESPVL